MSSRLHAGTLTRFPSNFSEFREEIAEALGCFFGPAAMNQYRQQAETQFRLSLQHPAVRAYAVTDAERTLAMLFAVVSSGKAARIPFYHVLSDYAQSDVPRLLASTASHALRSEGINHIVAECVSLGTADFRKTFTEKGFSVIERLLMRLEPIALCSDENHPTGRSVPLTQEYTESLGRLLAAVYERHPDRPIHIDLQNTSVAVQFVREVFSGSYGITRPNYVRGIIQENRLLGLVLGCEVSSDCGFVLHVAVHPDFQHHGLGTQLMLDLLREFRNVGLTSAALAVTATNPAVNLYERLGFKKIRRFDTYVWQQA